MATTGTRIGQLVRQSTVKGTADALENMISKLQDVSINPSNLFFYDDYHKVEELASTIKNSREYKSMNKADGNGYPSQGLTRYIEFLKLRSFHKDNDDAYNKQSEIDDYFSERDINEDFEPVTNNPEYLGTPRLPELQMDSDNPNIPRYIRSKQRSKNAIKIANYKCEIDGCKCELFKRKNSSENYTEPHHLIPMKEQVDFYYTIDTEENIVSLCSHCHNKIHYGDSKSELISLYNKRKDLLASAGIPITLEDLLVMYGY